jgi:hypothetical protein
MLFSDFSNIDRNLVKDTVNGTAGSIVWFTVFLGEEDGEYKYLSFPSNGTGEEDITFFSTNYKYNPRVRMYGIFGE